MMQHLHQLRLRGPQKIQEQESPTAPLRKKLRLALSDDELYGSLVPNADVDEDEVSKYIRMGKSDIGNDSNLLEWWSIQVRLCINFFLSEV